jgi:predicted phosphoribosyltransferase
MLFSSPQQSSQLLAQKLGEEFTSTSLLVFINSDAQKYCQLIAQNLSQPLSYLPDLLTPNTPSLILKHTSITILDDGSTPASEFTEFVTWLRQHHSSVNLAIATPVCSKSDEVIFQQLFDVFLCLHADPLFFSLNQFYQEYIL